MENAAIFSYGMKAAMASEMAEKSLGLTGMRVQEEKHSTPAKTPNSAGRLTEKPLLPLRERNSESRPRPHVAVPQQNQFLYSSRYRSPTDSLVSPVTRGLLSRNWRPSRTMSAPPKALETSFQDVSMVDAVGGKLA